MIAPLILYSPGSFLFFEQYSSSVVVPVIIPLGALLFYSLKTNVMTVLLITHPGTPNIYAEPTIKGYLGSIVP